jgi:hypothetical protein
LVLRFAIESKSPVGTLVNINRVTLRKECLGYGTGERIERIERIERED